MGSIDGRSKEGRLLAKLAKLDGRSAEAKAIKAELKLIDKGQNKVEVKAKRIKTTKKEVDAVSKLERKLAKLDGRSAEAKAIKAELAGLKKPVGQIIISGNHEEKIDKRKTTKYTEEEYNKAVKYFDNARSEVKSAIRAAYSELSASDIPAKTPIVVNNNMTMLNTAAVIDVLGITTK